MSKHDVNTASVMNDDATAVVSVRGLAKHYGDKKAVGGLDLEVRRGEIFAILGPNGAGKTTTLEILEGFRQRDAGSASVLGVDPGRPNRAWKARIGVVLQDSSDMADLTVLEAVSSTGSYYPNPRDARQLVEAVGLSDKMNERIERLSGGQRRRVDVALGVVGNPELLFLDEPTTGFDPEVRREFWELIRSLRDAGTTVILTTHYMDEAAALADRIAVIVNGKVALLTTPAEMAQGHESLEDAYLDLIAASKATSSKATQSQPLNSAPSF